MIDKKKVKEAVELVAGTSPMDEDFWEAQKILIDLAQSYFNGEIGEYVSEQNLWDIFAEVKGCKKAQVDCTFKKCMALARCKILIEALTGKVNISEQYSQYRKLLDKTRKYKEALEKITKNLPNCAIEEAREVWGNTNTNIILNARDTAANALKK